MIWKNSIHGHFWKKSKKLGIDQWVELRLILTVNMQAIFVVSDWCSFEGLVNWITFSYFQPAICLAKKSFERHYFLHRHIHEFDIIFATKLREICRSPQHCSIFSWCHGVKMFVQQSVWKIFYNFSNRFFNLSEAKHWTA